MFKTKPAYRPINSSKSSSSCPLYKNILCLLIGLIIGIRFTDIWYNIQNFTITETTGINEAADNSTIDHEMLPQYLYNTTRVLCWIMTSPENHLTKAIHIRHTWGSRCNTLLFMSTEEDEILQTVKLSVQEGREHLWNKTKEAFKYIYDHHLDDAEWFLKADDDTYFIMDNLRLFLYPYPADVPLYFGAKFKNQNKQVYMSGGAGYVLSKESLKKFVSLAYNNNAKCPKLYESEDVQLGLCLQRIGVIAGDSRDKEGNERFFPFAPKHLIPFVRDTWYNNYTYYPLNETCCSSSAISFHYIQPNEFYTMDYLLYSLRPLQFFAKSNYSLPKKLQISDFGYKPVPTPPSLLS